MNQSGFETSPISPDTRSQVPEPIGSIEKPKGKSDPISPDLLEKLKPVIINRITSYHNLFALPLIAEQWEETLHRSFGDIGIETSWEPKRSHTVGEDMRLVGQENSRISCKSGQFVKDRSLGECVKFSGSRSTSFPNLEDKIAHFSGSHDDYYFLLTKRKQFDKKYTILIFKSDICRVNQLKWEEAPSGKSWQGEGSFKATISKSMSDQLWTTLPLEMISYKFDIDCNV